MGKPKYMNEFKPSTKSSAFSPFLHPPYRVSIRNLGTALLPGRFNAGIPCFAAHRSDDRRKIAAIRARAGVLLRVDERGENRLFRTSNRL
jgi:hypothetical protein